MGFTCNDRNVDIKFELVIYCNSLAEVKFGNKQSLRVYLGAGIV